MAFTDSDVLINGSSALSGFVADGVVQPNFVAISKPFLHFRVGVVKAMNR